MGWMQLGEPETHTTWQIICIIIYSWTWKHTCKCCIHWHHISITGWKLSRWQCQWQRRGQASLCEERGDLMSLPSACTCTSCMLLWGHVAHTPTPHNCDLNPNELAQATVRRYITHRTKTVDIFWQQVPPQSVLQITLCHVSENVI